MSGSKGQMVDRKTRKGGQSMNTTYQTLIVKFKEPITALDGIFDDAQMWGTDTLKGWNMECVKEWLQCQTPIAEMIEF